MTAAIQAQSRSPIENCASSSQHLAVPLSASQENAIRSLTSLDGVNGSRPGRSALLVHRATARAYFDMRLASIRGAGTREADVLSILDIANTAGVYCGTAKERQHAAELLRSDLEENASNVDLDTRAASLGSTTTNSDPRGIGAHLLVSTGSSASKIDVRPSGLRVHPHQIRKRGPLQPIGHTSENPFWRRLETWRRLLEGHFGSEQAQVHSTGRAVKPTERIGREITNRERRSLPHARHRGSGVPRPPQPRRTR